MIDSKDEFLRLYRRGALGNTLRTWASLEEAIGSDHRGTFSVRDVRPNSDLSCYRVPYEDLAAVASRMLARGALGVHFNESAPDDRLVVQGEYMDGVADGTGLLANRYLMFSDEPVPMKRVARWRHAEGSAATAVLRHALDPASYDDLAAIGDLYPGHVVEFSAYDRPVGAIPGRNTIIWEVRAY
jgi:hypothetical protein